MKATALQHAIRRPWQRVFEGCDLCNRTEAVLREAASRSVEIDPARIATVFVPDRASVSSPSAVALAACYSPELLVVDEAERDGVATLSQLRAIVIVDDVPHGTRASGTRLRMLARPFTAEGLVAEVGQLLG